MKCANCGMEAYDDGCPFCDGTESSDDFIMVPKFGDYGAVLEELISSKVITEDMIRESGLDPDNPDVSPEKIIRTLVDGGYLDEHKFKDFTEDEVDIDFGSLLEELIDADVINEEMVDSCGYGIDDDPKEIIYALKGAGYIDEETIESVTGLDYEFNPCNRRVDNPSSYKIDSDILGDEIELSLWVFIPEYFSDDKTVDVETQYQAILTKEDFLEIYGKAKELGWVGGKDKAKMTGSEAADMIYKIWEENYDVLSDFCNDFCTVEYYDPESYSVNLEKFSPKTNPFWGKKKKKPSVGADVLKRAVKSRMADGGGFGDAAEAVSKQYGVPFTEVKSAYEWANPEKKKKKKSKKNPNLMEQARDKLESLEFKDSVYDDDLEEIRINGVDGFERSFRGGYTYFMPRTGVEDDDEPEFEGRHLVVQEIKDHFGDLVKNVDITIEPSEKGWFTIIILPKNTKKNPYDPIAGTPHQGICDICGKTGKVFTSANNIEYCVGCRRDMEEKWEKEMEEGLEKREKIAKEEAQEVIKQREAFFDQRRERIPSYERLGLTFDNPGKSKRWRTKKVS